MRPQVLLKLFSAGIPLFRSEGNLNGLTSAFVKEKVEELYALLTILPNFQAKNPAVFESQHGWRLLGDNGYHRCGCGGRHSMGAGQRSWQVFDSDFG